MYGLQADGTHPTGMLIKYLITICYRGIFFSELEITAFDA